MTTLLERKHSALLTLTGLSSGVLGDLEHTWLLAETGETSGDLNDLRLLWLEQQGYSSGTFPERMYTYLGDLGYAGTLNERLYQWWGDGGAVGTADSLLLESGDDLLLEHIVGKLVLE